MRLLKNLPMVLSLALVLGLVVHVGCSGTTEEAAETPESVTETQIAVVDINEVARQIGAMDMIKKSLSDYQAEVKGKLDEYKSKLDAEYQKQELKLSVDLNEQAKDELDKILRTNQASLNEQSILAQNNLAIHHNQLKLNLLNSVRPVAFDIANEQGMSIVLTTAQVYAAGPTADITKAVIARIKETNSKFGENPSVPAEKRVANLPGGGEFKPR